MHHEWRQRSGINSAGNSDYTPASRLSGSHRPCLVELGEHHEPESIFFQPRFVSLGSEVLMLVMEKQGRGVTRPLH